MVKWKPLSKVASLGMACMLGLAACSSTTSGSKTDSSKPYEIKMAYMSFTTIDSKELAAVQDEVNKIVKPKINATVKLEPINGSAYQQQINLLLSGSEQLDTFFTGSWVGLSNQVARGQVIPMDDLLKKYGQDVFKVIPEDVVNAAKINGKSYGVPTWKEFGEYYGVEFPKDLVDKYNIDLSKIKTWSDLEPVFEKINAVEPNMAPIANRGGTNTIVSDMMGGTFDRIGDNFAAVNMAQKSTKVVNLYDTKEYKDAVNMVHDWYKKGYVLKDTATNQQNANQLVKAGRVFSYLSNMKPGFDIQETLTTGKAMVNVQMSPAWANTKSVAGFQLAISKNSINPEKTMKFLNLLYSDKDLMNLIANGIEGKDYTKNSDGSITVNPKAGYTLNEWELGNNSLAHVYQGLPLDIWEQTKTFNSNLTPSPAYGFQFDASNVKTEIAALTNVVNQYSAGLESGTTDPATTLPKFNAALKAAGVDKVIDETQKQLDAFLKTK